MKVWEKFMQFDQLTAQRTDSISNYSVLRNTYFLLSLTLLFSSVTALFGMAHPIVGAGQWVVLITGFVLLFATTALRNSGWGILMVFAFTGCMGFSMGPFLNYFIRGYTNGGQLILTALGGTGAIFLISSGYILATRKDMSHLGKFLMIGLVVCIVAGLANFFLKMPALQLAISSLMVFISSLLLMYDTSRIINNGETNYIMATVSLFLDILMLFQNLLLLLGALSGNRRN